MWDDKPTEGKFGGRKSRYGEPVPRPKQSKPPCHFCPKCAGCEARTPEAGRQSELSDKNWQTLVLYERVQGSMGGIELDEVAQRNLGLIHGIVTGAERSQRNELMKLLVLSRG